MRGLGISIYPEQASIEENMAYVALAAKYGFNRVFTCLLSVGTDKERIVKEFSEITEHAQKSGMEVIADVSPAVFNDLGISYNDLKLFRDMKLSGIRLDEGFSGLEESLMTFNPYGIKIEINMSAAAGYAENILSFAPNKANLLGCHNFYPHRYTGLSREHFIRCSRVFKNLGLRTAAFVSSQSASFGPWKVAEGLCTLEEHRDLPIKVQAKDLFNTDLIDDVIIANAFASEEELKALGKLDREMLELDVEMEENAPGLCRKIVLEELHFCRGDVSEYMIRSTHSRLKYKGRYIEPFNTLPIKRGDILVESSLYDRYAGEMQIALKEMENSGKTNIVGRICSDEIFLLDHIEPWQKFKLYERGLIV
ncbi:MAG: DUF871 domain-containing protein [Bacillota bacterium]